MSGYQIQRPLNSKQANKPAPSKKAPAAMKVTADGLTIAGQDLVKTPANMHATFPVGNWDGQGLNDIAQIASNGDLLLFEHRSVGEYAAPRKLASSWSDNKVLKGDIDWDGNGTADIAALNNKYRLFIYEGSGKNISQKRRLNAGWNAFNDLLIVQRGPGGKPAILAAASTTHYVYPTNGRGDFTKRIKVKLPSLKGAVAGPDLWGSGYSTIISPVSPREIAVYNTKNGTDFRRSGTLRTSADVSEILNVSRLKDTEYAIDLLESNGSVHTVRLTAQSAAPPPAAPPVSGPRTWKDAAFSNVAISGSGWPKQKVYSMGDFDSDGNNDAALIDGNGEFYLYPSINRGTAFKARKLIGTYWHQFLDVHTGVDLTGDRRPDVIARAKNGELWLYPGNGRGGLDARTRIGTNWQIFSSVVVLRQGANGKPVIYGLSGDRLRPYPTNGQGKILASPGWINGYSWLVNPVASDDWNNDGLSDLILLDKSGNLTIVFQNKQGFVQQDDRVIGTLWRGFSALIPAYFDAKTKAIWSVDGVGKLRTHFWSYKGKGAKFIAPAKSTPKPVSQPKSNNRSYKDGPWLKHPIQWKGQPDDETCGPTSMWMVLNYLGAQRSAYDGKRLDVWTLKGRDYANVGTGWSGGTSWEDKRLSVGMNRWLGKNVYKQWTFPSGWDFRFKVIESFKTGRPVVVDTIENYGGPHYNGHVGTSSHIIVVNEYHSTNGAIGFIDPGGPGSAISGYSAQRTFRYPSAIDFGNNFLGNYGGGGHGMVY